MRFIDRIDSLLEPRKGFLVDHRALKKAVEEVTGIPIVVRHVDTRWCKGYLLYYPTEKDFPKGYFEVTLRKEMPLAQQLFTFIHEIGHILEGWIILQERPNSGWWVMKRRPGMRWDKVLHRYNDIEEEICDDIASHFMCPEKKLFEFMARKDWAYQLRLFEEFYPEKYWFFWIATTFHIPPKELGIFLKQKYQESTLKACMQKLKAST